MENKRIKVSKKDINNPFFSKTEYEGGELSENNIESNNKDSSSNSNNLPDSGLLKDITPNDDTVAKKDTLISKLRSLLSNLKIKKNENNDTFVSASLNASVPIDSTQ